MILAILAILYSHIYLNAKVFNLMSGVNEIRFLIQPEQCECKCGLNE